MAKVEEIEASHCSDCLDLGHLKVFIEGSFLKHEQEISSLEIILGSTRVEASKTIFFVGKHGFENTAYGSLG